MVKDILIVRKETRCRHIGYSYRLTARVLLYALSHRQDSTYHGLCYTSRGALVGTRNIVARSRLSLIFGCRTGERNVLFEDALNTFYLRLYGVRHMVKDILIVRKETRCRHIGYSYRLAARVLLYAPFHRQDSTYHGLCYTSRGALAGTRNSHHEGFI